ncbi:MAG: class I SAM-dependent methyltransferase [Nitriliruptorales bacterium]|nr:class I SAM-dependent methyltransferase [Nitriliruptorales bacterium]
MSRQVIPAELFAPVDDWFADLPIHGEVLELACGTGAWTRRLAARADQVHAIDVAPEMIEQAQSKVAGGPQVTFEVADLYRWEPAKVYDTVFFSFLLTHVPPTMASQLWQLVASSLARGGTVAFVDAAPDRQDEEEWLGDGIVRRTLRDGSVHRIVKVFPTPLEITAAMATTDSTGAWMSSATASWSGSASIRRPVGSSTIPMPSGSRPAA